MQLNLVVNGQALTTEIRSTDRLSEVLRNGLGLTGLKEGCREGECGSCTVLLDGKAVNSCLVLAYQARDSEVLTIEGLSRDGQPDALQQSFVDNGAIQCGFCSPGMIMAATALLRRDNNPSDDAIRHALAGNLCRCTGFINIIKAVRAAATADGHAARARGGNDSHV